jgi:hypothetical protein
MRGSEASRSGPVQSIAPREIAAVRQKAWLTTIFWRDPEYEPAHHERFASVDDRTARGEAVA